jgi:hypothetical protein
MFTDSIDWIKARYVKISNEYNLDHDQDDIQNCLLWCWSWFGTYDPTLSKPTTFLSSLVKYALLMRIRKHFLAKNKIATTTMVATDFGRKDFRLATIDHRYRGFDTVQDRDEVEAVAKLIGDDEVRYFDWYLNRRECSKHDKRECDRKNKRLRTAREKLGIS